MAFGRKRKAVPIPIKILFGVLIGLALAMSIYGDKKVRAPEPSMPAAESSPSSSHWWFKSPAQQVVDDTIKEFEIARRQGDPIQICVQAGLVAAAALQAHDEARYREWKDVEAEWCNR